MGGGRAPLVPADDVDDEIIQEGGGDNGDDMEGQVLVAAMPGRDPDVHIATLDADACTLNLQQASVDGGDVNLGPMNAIALTEVASVEHNGGAVALLASDGSVLAELHLESEEDGKGWADALRSAVEVVGRTTGQRAHLSPERIRARLAAEAAGGTRGPAAGAAAPRASPAAATAAPASVASSPARTAASSPKAQRGGDEENVEALRARSQKLQEQIESLEIVGQRREQQLKKILRRLDGAMGMLGAVQEMVGQQRKVIYAQKVAKGELESECGESAPVPRSPVASSPQSPAAASQKTASQVAQTEAESIASCASSRHRLEEIVRGSQQDRHRDWLQRLE